LNATLAGGVTIGAPSGLFTNPAASLCTGLGAGVVSTFGFIYLSKFLNNRIGLYDTCGVNNLHGIPGIIGGILSSIAIAAYQSAPIGSDLGNNLSFYSNNSSGRSFSIAACYQLAGLAISLAIGILAGIVAGFIMSLMYNMKD
jgi:ammonium transporter Rh